MRTKFAAFTLLISLLVTALKAAIITTPSEGVVQVGSFPTFTFESTNTVPTGWWATLVNSEGKTLGLIASGKCKGRDTFSWDMTRIFSLDTWSMEWPKEGKFKVCLFFNNIGTDDIILSGLAPSAETQKFSVVGVPPPLVVHAYGSGLGVYVYASGKPGEKYKIMCASVLDAYPYRWLAATEDFVIPREGVEAFWWKPEQLEDQMFYRLERVE